jgi:hypothetical protein
MSAIRRVLVNARTPMNYAMFAPVHRAMCGDPRVRFSFIASEDAGRARSIFRDAGRATRACQAREAGTAHSERVASETI